MRIAEKRMPVAVVGVLFAALLVVVMTLGSHSAVADPGGPVPNPGHAWTSIQGHGDDGDVYVSTQNDEAFEVRVNSSRALRLEPNATSPNLIGGYSGNSVKAGVVGAAICGGGAGGAANRAYDNYGTIGGGYDNQVGTDNFSPANDTYATVGGGSNNTASRPYATVGGGHHNEASDYWTTVGGGRQNIANDEGSTVAGGFGNTASEWYATVPGGYYNTADGDYSFAAGRQANANYSGCFVWGDSTAADVGCFWSNQFKVRASGGVYLYTSGTLSSGARLPTGSGTWYSLSDRDLKDNSTPVDGQEVVAALAEIPITTWNYTTQDTSIRHMGPVAQDLYAAFGLGDDERYISTIDADGVALAAIQGLYELSQEQAERIDDLEARVAALETGAPVVREAPAEAGSESLLSSMMPTGWLLLAGLVVGGLVVAQRRLAGGGR